MFKGLCLKLTTLLLSFIIGSEMHDSQNAASSHKEKQKPKTFLSLGTCTNNCISKRWSVHSGRHSHSAPTKAGLAQTYQKERQLHLPSPLQASRKLTWDMRDLDSSLFSAWFNLFYLLGEQFTTGQRSILKWECFTSACWSPSALDIYTCMSTHQGKERVENY